jgi:hypothetical protein
MGGYHPLATGDEHDPEPRLIARCRGERLLE